MGPFDLDFSHVQNVVAPPDRIPVLGNEHRMVRVAFDLFRLDGDDEERLWQVQTAEDGNEFLVRTYDLPEDVEDGLESRSADWSVMADSKLANLTVAYKGVPIHRLAAADYGARSPDEVRMLRQLVSEKLASDQAWAARFLCDLPSAKLAALRETFPELPKTADDTSAIPPEAFWAVQPGINWGWYALFMPEDDGFRVLKYDRIHYGDPPHPAAKTSFRFVENDERTVTGVKFGDEHSADPVPVTNPKYVFDYPRITFEDQKQFGEEREEREEREEPAADDPPAGEGLMEAYERLRDALKAQGGYDALSAEQQDRFNAAADKWDEIRYPGPRLDKESAKALLSEFNGLISEFEAGAEGAPEEAGRHGYPPEVEHFDLESAEDMYKLAAMALPYSLQWVQAEMQTTTEQLQKEVADALKRGGKVVRVSRGGKEPPHGSIWFYKSIGMREADDAADDEPATREQMIADYRRRLDEALKARGGPDKLSRMEKLLFEEAAHELADVSHGRGDKELLEELVGHFIEKGKHPGRIGEDVLKHRQWQRGLMDKIVEIAKELGHSGTFEKHDLPMAMFRFREGNDKAKEFLARTEQAGFGAGMLVGPGYAAVRIPTGW